MSESLPYNDLDQLAAWLAVTYTGKTNEIKQATEVLQKMSQNPHEFVAAMEKIISLDKTDTEAMKLKNAAIVTMTRCILERIKDNQIDTEVRFYIFKVTIGLMFLPGLNHAMKNNLQYFLVLLYSTDTSQDNQMRNEGFLLVKQKLSEPNVEYYLPAFMILQSTINTLNVTQDTIVTWFQEFRDQLLAIGAFLTENIARESEALAKEGDTESTRQKIDGLTQAVKILNYWVIIVYDFMKLLSKANPIIGSDSKRLAIIAADERFVEIIVAILLISLPTEQQLKSYFSTTGISAYDIPLNNLKTNVIRCFNKMIVSVKDMQEVLDPKDNKFFTISEQILLASIITGLVSFCKSVGSNIEKALKNKDLSEMITSSLVFLHTLVDNQNSNPLFLEAAKSLIMDVCFPLLRTSKDELELFTDNPQQFVELAVDACTLQASFVPKTQASKFMFGLCKNVDGSLSYFTLMALCMIEYSLLSNDPKVLHEKYKELAEHENSLLVAKTDPTTRVETSIFALCTVSALVGGRNDILKKIEELLKIYKDFFLGQGSNALIKSRICLLIGLYSTYLFQDKEKKHLFIEHLSFLINYTKIQDKDIQALTEQANQSLQLILDKEIVTKSSVGSYILDILLALSKSIATTSHIRTFEVILDTINSYVYQIIQSQKGPDVLLEVVKEIVSRIQVEMEVLRTSPTRETPTLIQAKLWSILNKIGETDEYMITLGPDIEQLLEPLLVYLDDEKKNLVTENILLFVKDATQVRTGVSPFCWKVLAHFPKIFEINGDCLLSLFPALNQIIVHGFERINEEPQTIETLINMGIKGLSPLNPIADESNHSEGALLLQLILQYLNPISDQKYQEIVFTVIEELTTAENDYLKARLGGVLICAFLNNFDLVQAILAKVPPEKNIFHEVIDFFIRGVLLFEENAYDRKLLIFGFCHILIQGNANEKFVERYREMFDIVISYLRYIRHIDAKKNRLGIEESDEDDDDDEIQFRKKEKMKDREVFLKLYDNQTLINATPEGNLEDEKDEEEVKDSDGDSLGDSDDDDEDYILGKTEDKELVKHLETKLKQEDEFECFRKAVIILKENNLPLLEILVKNLNDKKKNFLEDVLQSKRVNTNSYQTEARKIVKTRAKKVAVVQVDNEGNFIHNK